jgi:hypothetical protein
VREASPEMAEEEYDGRLLSWFWLTVRIHSYMNPQIRMLWEFGDRKCFFDGCFLWLLMRRKCRTVEILYDIVPWQETAI